MSHDASSSGPAGSVTALGRAIALAAHELPAQGPIGVFIHHNTLHALQHLPFEQAVEEAAQRYGTEPYLTEARYREEYTRGRISEAALDRVLTQALAAPATPLLGPRIDRLALARLLMRHPTDDKTPQQLRWQIEERDLLTRLRPDLPSATAARIEQASRTHWQTLLARNELLHVGSALTGHEAPSMIAAALRQRFGLALTAPALTQALERDGQALAAHALWHSCRKRARSAVPAPPPEAEPKSGPTLPLRHRDRLLQATGEDIDAQVNPLLIRLCAAFLDQGIAYWSMPERERGFYHAVQQLYLQGHPAPVPWLRELRPTLAIQQARRMGPEDVVHEILDELGVTPGDWPAYLGATLHALPGWAGMMHQLEAHPELALHHGASTGDVAPAICYRLVDFLAVRLLLERAALRRSITQHSGEPGIFDDLPDIPPPSRTPAEQQTDRALHHAHGLFQLMQLVGLAAHEVDGLTDDALAALATEVAQLDGITRRRLWHRAYELQYRDEILTALAAHTAQPPLLPPRPRFQVFFCIDDREEAIRRHLEEHHPDVETFGALGYFGIAVYFLSLAEPQPVPLCPIVIRPAHAVLEEPRVEDLALHQRRSGWRRLWANLQRRSFISSRSLVRGWLATLGLGLFAAFPLVMRSLFPRRVGRWSQRISDTLLPAPRSHLLVSRADAETEPAEEAALGLAPVGFQRDEKIERIARVLEDAGLVKNFAPLVALFGHGSTSLNNPLESAYDCGACGGRRGGTNARLFAEIANRPGVRAGLRARGIDIPESTWFLAGYHDTCTDEIVWFDREAVPATHQDAVAELTAAMEHARRMSAHERCRRFELASAGATPDEALAHVEARAAHLAEPRPECGHATNAICIVGRRALSRSLFLDRRAFLVSYDPTQDPQGDILARSLAAVVPVGAGISLEYYFSYVDNEGYGCGTKLPHNITGLLGVMNGHASDLRTGLPWQMVEIHEPMRLLAILETTPELASRAVSKVAGVAELVDHRWLQVATIDPVSRAIHVLDPGGFVPFVPSPTARPLVRVPASPAWYTGKREHLPPARIDPSLSASTRQARSLTDPSARSA